MNSPLRIAVALFFLSPLVSTAFAQSLPPEFERLDVNADGVLSGSEALTLLKYDADKNGEVSINEYISARQKEAQAKSRPTRPERGALDAKFRELDKNQDGRLSGTEMKNFEALDANSDRRITLEEFAAGQVDTDQPEPESSSVVVPGDGTTFEVEVGETVRLSGNGIAGSTIEAKVTGPARLIRSRSIRHLIEGQQMIGGSEMEFEIQATGPGDVTVLVKVDYPTGSPPMQWRYRFRVQPKDPLRRKPVEESEVPAPRVCPKNLRPSSLGSAAAAIPGPADRPGTGRVACAPPP